MTRTLSLLLPLVLCWLAAPMAVAQRAPKAYLVVERFAEAINAGRALAQALGLAGAQEACSAAAWQPTAESVPAIGAGLGVASFVPTAAD